MDLTTKKEKKKDNGARQRDIEMKHTKTVKKNEEDDGSVM